MFLPVLPESAPFSGPQRAWLNGFFAGVFNLAPGANGSPANGVAAAPAPAGDGALPEPEVVEEFPWHDPALPMDDRLKLAEGRPYPRLLMAAMAQLDCGSCGSDCKTYSEAIAAGTDTDLTKCSPGGKDTLKKLKELAAEAKARPVALTSPPPSANGHAGGHGPSANGHANGVTKAASGFDRKNPFLAPLLGCRPLNAAGSEKDVRHVAFSLKGSGLAYEVGDALGVWPVNDPELVEAVLEAMGARGDEMVPTPGGGEAHAYDALARSYVVTKVSGRLAALLADTAADPSEKATLTTLVNDDVEGIPAGWDVLDLLGQFPSARAPVADMVVALTPLQPRLYSISSSLKAHPDEVHLTVGVVRYTQAGRLRKGVASNFLTDSLRPRQKAGVFVHPSPGFRLPAKADTPVVMVGPGTGIAPFRAFLEDRQAGGGRGKNWLFFGDQRRDTDYLYQDEVINFQRNGVLTRIDLAFSRDQADKVYVQHRMQENGNELWKWLEGGAHFYVCGDARRMALDVDRALHAVVAEHGGLSADAAKDYVKAMTQAKRYQRDVY